METTIGIDQKSLESVAHILSKILADEFLISTKTRNAHWNVEGHDFFDKHKLFEYQYKDLDEIIDQVAERIRSLGHYAPATLNEFLELTQFTEQMNEKNDGEGYIKVLLVDHEIMIIELRKSISIFGNDLKDFGSSDFVTGLLKFHENMAWMLRAHLKLNHASFTK